MHLDKPEPFDTKGNMLLKAVDAETVQMPMWYWRKVYNYIIDADINQQIYEQYTTK